MNTKFENRDFEDFVKQNADQYRMFPSEKVWKGIHNTIHTRRRWYGAGLALLLLTTATVTGIMLSPNNKKPTALVANVSNSNAVNTSLEQTAPAAIINNKNAAQNKNYISAIVPDHTEKNLFPNTTSIAAPQPDAGPSLAAIAASIEKPKDILQHEFLYNNILPDLNFNTTTGKTFKTVATPSIVKKQIIKSPEPNNPAVAERDQSPITTTIIDNMVMPQPKTAAKDKNINSLSIAKNTATKSEYPMTIESVLNTYKNNSFVKKLVWQFHLIPTISYRKLIENKPFLEAARNSSGINQSGLSFSDINSVVTHKPDIGLQIGITAGYPVAKNITLTAGMQFNVSKYNIQATNHSSELATIALAAPAGGNNTVTAITNLRNVGGYKASWLHNKYISASLPIGAEINLSGNRSKTIIGIGATIQPTYILGNRAYLLSTDFKNYAEVPSLTRKWNLNTGLELFAAYRTGKVDWRIGPQVRYQIFSSFYNTYPIKEHLFDFGLKLGITIK